MTTDILCLRVEVIFCKNCNFFKIPRTSSKFNLNQARNATNSLENALEVWASELLFFAKFQGFFGWLRSLTDNNFLIIYANLLHVDFEEYFRSKAIICIKKTNLWDSKLS